MQGADRSQLARILSLANMPLLTAPIFGPMLGGALLGHIGWRWLFFISAPLSMIALAISYWVMPSTQGKPVARVDIAGIVYISPALALLIYAMTASSSGGSSSLVLITVTVTVTGVALFGVFIRHSIRLGRRPSLTSRCFGSDTTEPPSAWASSSTSSTPEDWRCWRLFPNRARLLGRHHRSARRHSGTRFAGRAHGGQPADETIRPAVAGD